MNRTLHTLILDAVEACDSRGVAVRPLARDVGITQSTMSVWSRRPLQDSYKKAATDAENEARVRRILLDLGAEPRPVVGGASPSATIAAPEEPSAPYIIGAGPHLDIDLAALRMEASRQFATKQRAAQKRKRQTIRFDYGPILIAFVGDQHIGNAGSNIDRMYRERDLICATPGAYAWGMGDLVDNFIVGRLMAQNMKPSIDVLGQWELARDYLHSFGSRLVAAVGGNHGAWTAMLTGIDYRRDVCPDGVLYDGDEIQADVRVGQEAFPIWARHQWSGSSIYNQTHGAERAARFSDPSFTFYVGAHLHTGAVTRSFVHEGRRKCAIQIGAYKEHDDYARVCGFSPSDGSTAAAVVLYDDGRWNAYDDLSLACDHVRRVYR